MFLSKEVYSEFLMWIIDRSSWRTNHSQQKNFLHSMWDIRWNWQRILNLPCKHRSVKYRNAFLWDIFAKGLRSWPLWLARNSECVAMCIKVHEVLLVFRISLTQEHYWFLSNELCFDMLEYVNIKIYRYSSLCLQKESTKFIW